MKFEGVNSAKVPLSLERLFFQELDILRAWRAQNAIISPENNHDDFRSAVRECLNCTTPGGT
jgi:hypothetical protein